MVQRRGGAGLSRRRADAGRDGAGDVAGGDRGRPARGAALPDAALKKQQNRGLRESGRAETPGRLPFSPLPLRGRYEQLRAQEPSRDKDLAIYTLSLLSGRERIGSPGRREGT